MSDLPDRYIHVMITMTTARTLVTACLTSLLALASLHAASAACDVKPLSAEQAAAYQLDAGFYKKGTRVQDILIVTSDKVGDIVHQEAAWLFDKVMGGIQPQVAQRIRERKVLCILVGHAELVSDLPEFATDKTGAQRDFYNWRNRGSLSTQHGHPTVLFSEEDVMEYQGGMQLESIPCGCFRRPVLVAAFFNIELHSAGGFRVNSRRCLLSSPDPDACPPAVYAFSRFVLLPVA